MGVKIGIVSDLHLEKSGMEMKNFPEGLDVLVNAGDTHPYPEIRAYAASLFTEGLGCKYFEVLGNHDFYGGGFPFPGQNQKIAKIGGLLFAGATLWTRITPQEWDDYCEKIADSSRIDDSNLLAYSSAHASDLNFILKSGADVVVTHHSPAKRGAVKYAGNELNYFFHNDLDDIIASMKKPPKLWIHGHSHERVDYRIGGTRVISNPRGYPFERDVYDGYSIKEVEINV